MSSYSTKGIIDLHVHAGPSVAPRSVDAVEMFNQAKEAGYAGFVLKEHYIPTTTLAETINKHLRTGESDPVAYGGVVLNNSVGGLSTEAIDANYCAGARFVCLSTVSAWNHLDRHKVKFSGSGDMVTVETPIYYLDGDGKLKDDIKEVLKFCGERPDLMVMTGHCSAREIDALVPAAMEYGIKKLLVNHPHYEIGATNEQVKRWAEQGAYIELNACVFAGISRKTAVPLSVAAELIEAAGDRLVLDSDLGQRHNDPPCVALPRFIGFLQDELGVTDAYLDQILKTTPAMLMAGKEE